MPTFQGLITEEELLQLIAYIKSLLPRRRAGRRAGRARRRRRAGKEAGKAMSAAAATPNRGPPRELPERRATA